jgi:hypothetical protein
MLIKLIQWELVSVVVLQSHQDHQHAPHVERHKGNKELVGLVVSAVFVGLHYPQSMPRAQNVDTLRQHIL